MIICVYIGIVIQVASIFFFADVSCTSTCGPRQGSEPVKWHHLDFGFVIRKFRATNFCKGLF